MFHLLMSDSTTSTVSRRFLFLGAAAAATAVSIASVIHLRRRSLSNTSCVAEVEVEEHITSSATVEMTNSIQDSVQSQVLLQEEESSSPSCHDGSSDPSYEQTEMTTRTADPGSSVAVVTDVGLGNSVCDEEGGEESSSNSVTCSDSGRGSDADELHSTRTILAYHLRIPDVLCGRFIGSKGVHVNRLKNESKCRVILKESSDDDKRSSRRKGNESSSNRFQLCIIEGTRTSIEKCLEFIRERFPSSEYPELTLEQTNIPVAASITPALSLAFGVMNEIMISAIVSPNHVFLHQPSHPTYTALQRLNDCMSHCYNDTATPELDSASIVQGVVCIAYSGEVWYRVQIVSYDSESGTCDVKFLDYGGYSTMAASDLRQIRSDFLSLPFQAVECYLANISPCEGESEWSPEAMSALAEVLSSKIGTAVIHGISEDAIPLVHLFVNDTPEITVNVNRLLADRNVVGWIDDVPPYSSESSLETS